MHDITLYKDSFPIGFWPTGHLCLNSDFHTCGHIIQLSSKPHLLPTLVAPPPNVQLVPTPLNPDLESYPHSINRHESDLSL